MSPRPKQTTLVTSACGQESSEFLSEGVASSTIVPGPSFSLKERLPTLHIAAKVTMGMILPIYKVRAIVRSAGAGELSVDEFPVIGIEQRVSCRISRSY